MEEPDLCCINIRNVQGFHDTLVLIDDSSHSHLEINIILWEVNDVYTIVFAACLCEELAVHKRPGYAPLISFPVCTVLSIGSNLCAFTSNHWPIFLLPASSTSRHLSARLGFRCRNAVPKKHQAPFIIFSDVELNGWYILNDLPKPFGGC